MNQESSNSGNRLFIGSTEDQIILPDSSLPDLPGEAVLLEADSHVTIIDTVAPMVLEKLK